MKFFPNLRADIKVYDGDFLAQGFWVMIVYRFGRWRYTIGSSLLRKPFSLLYKLSFKAVQILTGIELPCEVKIGENFKIEHFGDIIVSGYARFGNGCIIRNGVTVGLQNIEHPAAPLIGNNVNIGVGAKLLGDITIGDNVDIGANAVIIRDIPDNCIAVGIPARIISRNRSR
ncbi:MAG: serine acetyltransferase [Desulfobacteraceae bacterium 4572_123]|nr:MAG: serine acetyltransferase [Desulfobacteraceae bacterium 4572_123]